MGSKREFAEAVEHVAGLFPNMTVLSRLSQSLKDLNTGLDEIAPLIRTDAMLTSEVIKISNSSYYRAGEPCKDVIDALTRIGFGEVLRVVSTILAKDVCSHDLDKYGISSDEFWEETLTVSTLIEALAKCRRINPADAATVGVLHALGRPVINHILEEFAVPILWDSTIEVAEWERIVVGFDYTVAGARVMRKWKFPVEIIYDVAYHLAPEKAPKPRPLLDLLHYSVKVAPIIGFGYKRTGYTLPSDKKLVERVGLDEETIRQAIAEAAEAFAQLQNSVFSS